MVLLNKKRVLLRDLPSTFPSVPAPTSASSSALPPPPPLLSHPNGLAPPSEPNGLSTSGDGPSESSVDPDVLYLPQTGEIFQDYESYASRVNFYRQKRFTCEVTHRANLTYFQALESERREAQTLHTRFPEPLKVPVLASVQFLIMNRIDAVVDACHDRFSNRFFVGEKVFVDVQGVKYYARIARIFPPRRSFPSYSIASSSAASASASSSHPPAPHALVSDLMMSQADADRIDDPRAYFYSIQLVESNGTKDERCSDSYMEVTETALSRDRVSFSKTIIKKLLKECIERKGQAVTSPWIVKPAIALQHGIPTEPSEQRKEAIESFQEGVMEKRKRTRPEEEGSAVEVVGPADAKRKKLDNGSATPTTRKKPIKYPAEDLLCELTSREISTGKMLTRPPIDKNLPFSDLFETFLTTWSCLNSLGKALQLSPFSIDDYESALYYNQLDPPHPLIIEIHCCLINVILRDPLGARPLASYGGSEAFDRSGSELSWVGKEGMTEDRLIEQARKVSHGWMGRGTLKTEKGRQGWETHLIGVLVDRATSYSLPHQLDYLSHLLFTDEEDPDENPTWVTSETPDAEDALRPTPPAERYPSLHPVYKLEIISFLCELAVQTKFAKDAMEESMSALTEVRKELLDVRRDRKKLAEERLALDGPVDKAALAKLHANLDGAGDDAASVDDAGSDRPDDAASLSEPPLDDDRSETASTTSHAAEGSSNGKSGGNSTALSRGPSHRRQALRQQQLVKEAEANMKAQAMESNKMSSKEDKEERAERKRIESEDARLAAREEELDREFRRFIHLPRSKPVGIDRFCNKIWWFDGTGSMSALSTVPFDTTAMTTTTADDGTESASSASYGTGRLYIQGSTAEERRRLGIKFGVPEEEIAERRKKEEGEEGLLEEGEWGVYDEPDKLDAFIMWLNPKGLREVKLIEFLKRWEPHLKGSMARRQHEILMRAQVAATSRVTRGGGGDRTAMGSLGWRNLLA